LIAYVKIQLKSLSVLVLAAGIFLAVFVHDSRTPEPEALEAGEKGEKLPSRVVRPGAEESVSVRAKALPADFPTRGLDFIKADSSTSPDPVERAVAKGTVLDMRMEATNEPDRWRRVRLVRTEVQPRLVRVVESWRLDWPAAQAVCLKREMFLADQLIVKLVHDVGEADLRKRLESAGMKLTDRIADGLFTVQLATADLDAMPAALKFFAEHPELVESAEPDGVGFGGGEPNDPRFSEQWGLHNTGQSGGVADADVDGPEFWEGVWSVQDVVIAVLDSGLNFTHPDLQNRAWINPGEVEDGLDNDSSGKIDDLHGWDFVNNDKDPSDDLGHGSHVAGIIAANRNNGVGVAGMLDDVPLLVCKVINANNSGLTSHLIASTTYARLRGVEVMNLSLQNYPYSAALSTEFDACEAAGIVLVICAGNQGVNNDATPNYPSSYAHSNIIAVGNHERNDVRWSGASTPSNYGLTSVDLFAPGREILSTVLGTAYGSWTGTSMSTPFVAAVCCVVKSANPAWTAAQVKASVLDSVVIRPSYGGICVTGGRLNAFKALAHSFRLSADHDSDGDGSSNLMEYLAGTRLDDTLSRPELTRDISGGFFQISMPRVLRSDAHLVVEASSDLVSWTTTGVTDSSTAELLQGRISLSGSPRGFLRIRAALLSP
jgi:subtilisin family serine protease